MKRMLMCASLPRMLSGVGLNVVFPSFSDYRIIQEVLIIDRYQDYLISARLAFMIG